MSNARTHLAAAVALGAALAMPLALAQSAVTPEIRDAQKAASESAEAAQAAEEAEAAQDVQDAAQPASPPAEAQPASRQLGWNDVDADGNGTISRAESAALPALAAVFDEADADGDGELTAEEYRAHAAAREGSGG